MSFRESEYALEPVYFAKPGDTVQKAAKTIFGGQCSSEQDLARFTRQLVEFNPRLNKPSYLRTGNMIPPRTILSLEHPAYLQSANASLSGHVGQDQLIQFQQARERGLESMDPELRQVYEAHSASPDPRHGEFFDNVAMMGWAGLETEPYVKGLEHVFGGFERLERLFKVGDIEHKINHLYAYMRTAASQAQAGTLNSKVFNATVNRQRREINALLKRNNGVFLELFKSDLRAAKKTVRSYRLPRGAAHLVQPSKHFTNATRSFNTMRLLRLVRGIGIVATGFEIYVRGSKVWHSDHPEAEAAVQIAGLAAVQATTAITMLVCGTVAVPTVGLGTVACVLGVGGVLRYFAEEAVEHQAKHILHL